MVKIFAKDRNMTVNTDISCQLSKTLKELALISEEKELIFEKGDYYISGKNCDCEKLYLTNSMADGDWNEDEERHVKKVAINIKNTDNLKLVGNGANFIIDGRVTNLVINNSSDITIEDIAFDTVNPDMHEFVVTKIGAFSVDFALNTNSRYVSKGRNFYFVGSDYESNFCDNLSNAFWIGQVPRDDKDTIRRVAHPFMGRLSITEIAKYNFRVKFLFKRKFNVGDKFYIFDHYRKNSGIAILESKNVILDKISQSFNYGLGLVAQDTENLTVKNCRFAPKDESIGLLTSVADFMHLCMCKGDIVIKDSYFAGAGDDCLNVHGIHYGVTNIKDNVLNVRYCHEQAFGFNPLHTGDEVEFVNKSTLLAKGKGKILASRLVDEKNIELTLDSAVGCAVGDVIEDITMRPNLLFEGNKMTRIITRGILVTTGSKVVIKDNDFDNTSMHSILISDDARNWYESGRVNDVTIINNRFGRCPMKNIFIKPENTVYAGAVHKNILIKENIFSAKGGGIYIKATDNVVLEDNVGLLSVKQDNSDITIKS